MASQLEEILSSLAGGKMPLDDACRALTQAARANPSGTQLWPMLIEARVTQNEITPAIGRALCEALENFEPEKTMWLAPAKKNAPAVTGGEILRTPASRSEKSGQSSISATGAGPQTPEQLRAFLWDEPGKKGASKSASDSIPTLAPPPRAMPGTAPVMPPLELGTVIKNRYRLESHLGFGGIGQVFSAIDLEAGKRSGSDPRVTLKMIAVDLKREPQAHMAMKIAVSKIKPLRHPNVVTTIGVEADNDRLFVVMEPLFGRWLGERLRSVRNVGMSQEVAWPIIEGIANGLAYAHRHGIVHSDLSPYSIFIANDGTPKIMSFGLVHALPTSNEAMDLLDTMTLRAYSEAYTANVWATHGTPHPSDDLYPLGVIAYELLSGKHPFQRTSLTVARQKGMQIETIPGLKRRAAKLIAHCLSFEGKYRPSDGDRFLRRMQGPAWLRYLFGERFSVASPQ